MACRVTDKVDFGLYCDIERLRYTDEEWKAMGVTREFFIESSKDLPQLGFEIDGKAVGGAYIEHNECHVAVHPDYHGRWGRLVRPMWEWMLSVQDPIMCRVENTNEKCLKFLDHAGWPRLVESDGIVFFLITSELLGPARGRGRDKPVCTPADIKRILQSSVYMKQRTDTAAEATGS